MGIKIYKKYKYLKVYDSLGEPALSFDGNYESDVFRSDKEKMIRNLELINAISTYFRDGVRFSNYMWALHVVDFKWLKSDGRLVVQYDEDMVEYTVWPLKSNDGRHSLFSRT